MSPFEATAERVDAELLAEYLKALANPARIQMLTALRAPAKASDLELKPARRDSLSPDRAVSRQTVNVHLRKLEDAGVVTRLTDPAGGADRWVTNVPHLFAVVEELRKLATIPPADVLVADPDETVAHADGHAADPSRPGPKLIVLTGPWEGRAIPLGGTGPWSLGRSRSRDVALTYDPFVSAEHATLQRAGDAFELAVAATARNPARVNFADVPAGSSRALAHGDVVGLGRTLLLVHER